MAYQQYPGGFGEHADHVAFVIFSGLILLCGWVAYSSYYVVVTKFTHFVPHSFYNYFSWAAREQASDVHLTFI